MTEMVAGISKASIEREAAMMEASSNFIWARKIRALRAALDKAEAERDRLRALPAVQPDAREAALREVALMAENGMLPLVAEQCRDAILALIDKPALPAAHHVNETPKSEHDARDVLTTATEGGDA